MASPRLRRSEIPIGRHCAATRHSLRMAPRRLWRSTLSLRSTPRCRICIGSIRPARRQSSMRRPRPIANVRISTARMCWKAGSPLPARPTADGLIAHSPRCSLPGAQRGPAPVLSWTPRRLPPASDDTLARLLDLYRHTDPALARALEERVGLATIARAGGMDGAQPRAAGAGRGLANLLSALDGAIAAIETEMKEAWGETVVAVITEFGRTARINGTEGTDHGTATVAVLAGGALKGGRMVADWPGLKAANLHEGRDLKPTTDLRAVLKGVLKDHLRVDEAALAAKVFPDSARVKPMAGLLRQA